MAGPGFGRDEGDRHPFADVAALEVCIDQEGIFVERSQHAGAGRRPDHDRSGVAHELAIGRQCAFGLVDVDYRMRVVGEAGNRVGHAAGARGDQQRIVIQHITVLQVDLDDVGMDAFDGAVDEFDAARLQIGRDGKGNVGTLAPTHGDPGIGRHEVEIGLVRHHRHFVVRAQLGFQGVGRGHARDAGSQDDNMRHFSLLDSLGSRCSAARAHQLPGAHGVGRRGKAAPYMHQPRERKDEEDRHAEEQVRLEYPAGVDQ